MNEINGNELNDFAQIFRQLGDLGPIEVESQLIEDAIALGLNVPSAIQAMLPRGGLMDADNSIDIQRAMAGWVLMSGIATDQRCKTPLRISTTPSDDVFYRRSLRLLSMVHELHKVGYQRLRIAAGMSPSGAHWRCNITHAANVGLNGWEPLDWSRDTANYTSADSDAYFGWADASGKSARQLANLFIERFPEIVEKGLGRDRQYAGWYVDMLGAAENGRLPIFFADYPLVPNPEEMPPPSKDAIFASLRQIQTGF